MKTKRLCVLLLTVLMAIGLLAGCSSQMGNEGGTNDGSTAAAAENAASNNKSSGNTSTLVVYFSGTGNTKNAAEMIANKENADLFEIEPAEPYSSDDLNYNDDNSRVCREYNDESLRNIQLKTATPDNWQAYDVVYVGYPIWWGIAAWPVSSFVSANDFSGKTVIPFCTSVSSGLGQSGELLAKAAGTGDWKDGQRFSSGVTQSDIDSWLDSLK